MPSKEQTEDRYKISLENLVLYEKKDPLIFSSRVLA